MNMESERNLMTTTEAARYLGLKPSYLYKITGFQSEVPG